METGITHLRRLFAILSALAMLIVAIGEGAPKPDYQEPLRTVDFPLVEELVRAQGITTDGDYYYFSSNYGLLKTELDALTVVKGNPVAIPAELLSLGVKHLGGITYADGKLYAGAEDSKVFENLYICVFDAETLECIDYKPVSGEQQENGIPWVAADSENGILYSARRDYPEVLNMYDLETLEFIGTRSIDYPVHKVQGGDVYDGVLYLSVSRGDQAVYAVRLSDGHVEKAISRNLPEGSEGEGMTVLPTEDGGFFHVLDIAGVRIAGHLRIYSFEPGSLFSEDASPLDYSDGDLWAFSEADAQERADVFIVAPTVYYGDTEHFNMPIDDVKNRARMVGALNMQPGIYNGGLNVFSPYYRQASLSAVNTERFAGAYEVAYSDISAAFNYYINNINDGRPFVLAGFSQGADMCKKLMKQYPRELKSMIACYLYGCAVTDKETARYPQLVPASGEADTGVIVCVNSEAPGVFDTFTVPAGTKSICINPLNWRTDGTPADKSLNKGACMLDYTGVITKETPGFTGAYIDTARGTLKLPDIDPADWVSKLTFLKYGEYHMYEYEFFYRNLEENVKVRTDAWFTE